MGGEETVLIPAPGAYPATLSNETQECFHQGLRVVYVLAQYMPNYLEVGPTIHPFVCLSTSVS